MLSGMACGDIRKGRTVPYRVSVQQAGKRRWKRGRNGIGMNRHRTNEKKTDINSIAGFGLLAEMGDKVGI